MDSSSNRGLIICLFSVVIPIVGISIADLVLGKWFGFFLFEWFGSHLSFLVRFPMLVPAFLVLMILITIVWLLILKKK